MSKLIEQLAISDPRARLAHTLQRFDDHISIAQTRKRSCDGQLYPDPDTHAVCKLEALAQQLLAEYHSRTLASVESIGTLDRAQAIAELEAVLAVWKDYEGVSDEQWLAARLGPSAAPKTARGPKPGVVRRLKTAG